MAAKDPTLKLLNDKIRLLMNDKTDTVAVGGCEDFADYRHQTGIIQGLALAKRELLDIDEMLYRDEK